MKLNAHLTLSRQKSQADDATANRHNLLDLQSHQPPRQRHHAKMIAPKSATQKVRPHPHLTHPKFARNPHHFALNQNAISHYLQARQNQE